MESFWSVFEAKRCNVLFKKMYCKGRSFVVELIVLELRTKSFGKSSENASKSSSNFSTNQGQIEAFLFYKLNISRDEIPPKQQVCPCFRRSNILAHELYRYSDKSWTKSENRKSFETLSSPMSTPDSFRLKNGIDLLSKHTGQHTLSLLALFNVPVDEVCRKFEKKCIKSLKIGKFWDFCQFRCQFGHFHSKQCNYLCNKDYWTTNSFLVDPLNPSIPRQKLNKNGEIRKIFWIFVFFDVNSRHFSFKKLQLSLHKKQVDNDIYLDERFHRSNSRSLSKIRQKLHKNFKNREIFWFFVIFGFFFPKKRIYLSINDYWTTISCLVEPFQHSNPRHLSKNWQKLH